MLKEWGSRWQPIDAVNDDGVDGLIFIERGGKPSGEIIYVQVKSQSLDKAGTHYAVKFDTNKLKANLERWKRVVGAAILIQVDPRSLDAYWVDLRDVAAIGGTIIRVPVQNKFDLSAKREIAGLCGTLHLDLLLPRVPTGAADYAYLFDADGLKSGARAFYRSLRDRNLVIKGLSQPIHFTKEGWRHLNRVSRARSTRLQSLQLLGAIPRIVDSSSATGLVRVRAARGDWAELVGLSAVVTFPSRQAAVVKLVFRRRTAEAEAEPNLSFHTIYEPRRKRDLKGLGGYGITLHP